MSQPTMHLGGLERRMLSNKCCILPPTPPPPTVKETEKETLQPHKKVKGRLQEWKKLILTFDQTKNRESP